MTSDKKLHYHFFCHIIVTDERYLLNNLNPNETEKEIN